MTQTQTPPKWTAHGAFRSPRNVVGVLPRHGVHYLVTGVQPATLPAVLADMASDTHFLI